MTLNAYGRNEGISEATGLLIGRSFHLEQAALIDARLASLGISFDPETGEIFETENGGHPQGELRTFPPAGDAETRPVVESPHACGDGAVQDRFESTAPTNPGAKAEASAPAPEPCGSGEDPEHVTKDAGQSASRLPSGRTLDGERHPTSGVTARRDEQPIPERREGEQAPEATPSSSSNPVPDGGETAATDLLEIPWFLRRNPDNSLPGRAH